MHWTIHLEGGPQRVNHAAVAIDNKIYTFGGYSSSEGYEVTGEIDIYVLNTDTLRWSPLFSKSLGTEVPFRRYGHSVVAYGHKIYLWGGRNDYRSSSLVHCFDINTCLWSIPATWGVPPLAGDGHSACVIDNYMYIFGGFQDDTEKFGQNLHRLNLKTYEWEKVETSGHPPVSRDFHTASAIGSKMYIFGGRSASIDETANNQVVTEFYCNKIMYFDTASRKWVMPKTSGHAPSGRRSHSAVVYNDQIYIFGGYDSISQIHLNDFHKFNPASNKWFKLYPFGKGPCPRRRHCTCIIDDKLFLFGGSSPRVEGEKVPTEQIFQKLIDHSDLYVLEFFPSLKRFCQLKIIECKFSIAQLPSLLVKEIHNMTTNNTITRNDFFPRKDYGVFSFSA